MGLEACPLHYLVQAQTQRTDGGLSALGLGQRYLLSPPFLIGENRNGENGFGQGRFATLPEQAIHLVECIMDFRESIGQLFAHAYVLRTLAGK